MKKEKLKEGLQLMNEIKFLEDQLSLLHSASVCACTIGQHYRYTANCCLQPQDKIRKAVIAIINEEKARLEEKIESL